MKTLLQLCKQCFGLPREIHIKDSRRQGAPLGAAICPFLDGVNMEIQGTDFKVKILDSNTSLPRLLLIDDILITETTVKETRTVLDVTNKANEKHHIQFVKKASAKLNGPCLGLLSKKCGLGKFPWQSKITYNCVHIIYN